MELSIGSVIKHLLGMHGSQGLIPSIPRAIKEKRRNSIGSRGLVYILTLDFNVSLS